MKRLFLSATVVLLLAGLAQAQYKVRRFKGGDLNDAVIDSEKLVSQKIAVTDFMGKINKNFAKVEQKRGYRGPYYTKFYLRDSKLRCLVSKYDMKNFDRFNKIRRDDRVTVMGRIEQLAFGFKRFSNPYYVLKVSHIEPGWRLEEHEDIFSGFARDTEYEDLKLDEVITYPEKYAGECFKVKDRFSVRSTFFTVFEKDLNLDSKNALKFYLEDSAWPCYMPNTEGNRKLLGKLKSGQKITVCGRMNLSQFEDDALLLFSVSRIKIGW